jgi:hypothetical protein
MALGHSGSGDFGALENSGPDAYPKSGNPEADRKPNMDMSTSGGGGSGFGSARKGKPQPSLADYLPNGSQYSANGVAGAAAERPEVQPRSVDIWGQVSQRYLYRCKLGLLVDCHSH